MLSNLIKELETVLNGLDLDSVKSDSKGRLTGSSKAANKSYRRTCLRTDDGKSIIVFVEDGSAQKEK